MTPQEFRKLQAEWYGKLAASGFHDLEYRDGSLKSDCPGEPSRPRSEYFSAARDVVNAPDFARRYNPRHQRIIELHAAGATNREIGRAARCMYLEILTVIAELRKRIGVRP